MLQDQPDELPVEQTKGFVDNGATRVVDDEPLVEDISQDHHEGYAQNESFGLGREINAVLSHDSPIHISVLVQLFLIQVLWIFQVLVQQPNQMPQKHLESFTLSSRVVQASSILLDAQIDINTVSTMDEILEHQGVVIVIMRVLSLRLTQHQRITLFKYGRNPHISTWSLMYQILICTLNVLIYCIQFCFYHHLYTLFCHLHLLLQL